MVTYTRCTDGCVPGDGLSVSRTLCSRCFNELCARCRKAPVQTLGDFCGQCPPWLSDNDERMECGHFEPGDCDFDCTAFKP